MFVFRMLCAGSTVKNKIAVVSVSLGLEMSSISHFSFLCQVSSDLRTRFRLRYYVRTCKISDSKGGSMNLINK